MKSTLFMTFLMALTGVNAVAEETTQQNTKAKSAVVTYEQTMKNYANKAKDAKKDLDKASQDRQNQLDAMEKKIDADSN